MNGILRSFDALSQRKPPLKLEIRFDEILRKKFASCSLIGFFVNEVMSVFVILTSAYFHKQRL